MSNYKTILIPTDLSEASEPAADRAKSLADLSGAKIVLLHIVDYFLPGQAGKFDDIPMQHRQ
ncbi:MAG: universal stress protein [Proteobacteria bacterium]|mgnify:CR=1|jgi:nucleotide-binding universal stress UspA family protein|nr:universal stress protein [Pseudomonadota bacterium]